MKITIDKKEFISKLSLVANIAKENKIRPILQGVKIEATEDNIVFTATDLEQTIITKVEGTIREIGIVVIDAKDVLDYTKESENVNINIEQTGNMIKIDNAEFVLYNEDEYPTQNIVETEGNTIEKEWFINGLEKASIAYATDTNNIALCCINVDLINGCMASSDSYRMLKVNVNHNVDFSKLVPATAIKNLITTMKNSDCKDVSINQDGSKVGLQIGDTDFYFRTIDLQFPDYLNIYENIKTEFEIQANTAELKKKLKKLNSIAAKNIEAKNAARFEVMGKEMYISGQNQKVKAKESVDIINLDMRDISIGLNVKFLLDYLPYSKETTVIRFGNDQSAVMVNDEYLLMPLAIRND